MKCNQSGGIDALLGMLILIRINRFLTICCLKIPGVNKFSLISQNHIYLLPFIQKDKIR